MNIGISFYFGFEMKTQETARMIKDSGFECVMTNADKRYSYQNGNIRKQIKYFKKSNLSLSSLHMAYKNNELVEFWHDNKIGKRMEKSLKRDLKIAHKYGFTCVVIHLHGEYSEFGIERLKRLLLIAKKLNVPLALENTVCQKLFIKVMEEFKDEEYLKFCYDSGHNHVFDPEFDYLKTYGDRLVALHLHDNDGSKDQHTLNRFGTIDWDDIASKLAKCSLVNLDYELILYKKCDLSAKEVLEECYKQAIDLRNLINEKRANLNN